VAKVTYGPDVPELTALARSVGGWRGLAQIARTNAGSLAAMAKGRRRMSMRVRRLIEANGARPAGWHATVAAIVAWAEQPAPRTTWRTLEHR